jgi:hypothetical protein
MVGKVGVESPCVRIGWYLVASAHVDPCSAHTIQSARHFHSYPLVQVKIGSSGRSGQSRWQSGKVERFRAARHLVPPNLPKPDADFTTRRTDGLACMRADGNGRQWSKRQRLGNVDLYQKAPSSPEKTRSRCRAARDPMHGRQLHCSSPAATTAGGGRVHSYSVGALPRRRVGSNGGNGERERDGSHRASARRSAVHG